MRNRWGSFVFISPGLRSGFAILAVAGAIFSAPIARAQLTPAQQAGLDLGSDRDYAFIDLGATTLGWNSGPITGSVLFGQGLKVSMSGGNNGGLSNGGTLFYDGSTTLSGNLQNPPSRSLVDSSVTETAATLAENVSSYASSLTPTQTFTNITNPTTFTGNGGLNVIDVTDIHNAKLTLSGTANDYFVFNVTGELQTNRAMTLSGGVLPSHVLFNLTGSGTVLFQTSGGDLLYGTYLATNGGNFQFSELELNGELINTGGNVQFVSGSEIVPEPGVVSLLILSAVALIAWRGTGICRGKGVARRWCTFPRS
jgi:hypothetical protein